MKWNKNEFSGFAVKVEQADRQARAQKAREFIDAHPDEQFYFNLSGDCLVVGMRCGPELFVFDAVPVTEWYAHGAEQTTAKQGVLDGFQSDLFAWVQRFCSLAGEDGFTQASKDRAFARLYDAMHGLKKAE